MSRFTPLGIGLALGVAAAAAMTPRAFAGSWTDPFILALRAPAKSTDRVGDLSLGAVIRTDERYGSDRLFQGPRGWDYWNRLENPKPDQDPNLWPDKRPSYLVGQMAMPTGSSITVHGTFPHARYFNVSLYKFERNTFVAVGGESLDGWDIEAGAGSGNPYRAGADRLVENRGFTLHILAQDAPRITGSARPIRSMSAATDRKCSSPSAYICPMKAMTVWAGGQQTRPPRSPVLLMKASLPTGPGFQPNRPPNVLAARSAPPLP